MDKLNNSVKGLIQEAESLNEIKTAAIEKLEGRLNTCPRQWQDATREFMKTIRANIKARLKLINDLKRIDPYADPRRIIKITYKLEDLNQKDDRAINKYTAAMNDGLN